MNGDATKIREEVLSRIEEIKKFLQNLVNGDLGNNEAKDLAMAIKRVMEHSNKKIEPGKALDKLIRNLESGKKFSSWPGKSRTSGTNWENLVIGAIQLLVVDKLDLEGPGILRKGESPDLPDLEIDIKSSTKKTGQTTSTSAKSNTAIGAFKARLTGLDYDILYLRFVESKIERLELLGRLDFADRHCLEIFRGCAKVLDGDWDSRDSNLDSPDFKKLMFMMNLFTVLVLKKNRSQDDIFPLLENLIQAISSDDVTSGLTITEMQERIREIKKQRKHDLEERRRLRNNFKKSIDEAQLKEFDKGIEDLDVNIKSIRIGTGKDVSTNYKKLFDEEETVKFLLSKIRGEELLGDLNDIVISTQLGDFPQSADRVEKLLWLSPLLNLAAQRTHMLHLGTLRAAIKNSLREQKPKFSITTKSFELNIEYSNSKEEE